MQDMNGLLEQLRKMFGQQGGQVTSKPALPNSTQEIQDALTNLGAKPMGPAVMPPNMTNKPMPLGDMAGVFNDMGMGPKPAPQPTSPRIPKSGGGRNLQRVSPGVYRNQKGGLVQRKTGGR